jgi:hypothetical protein
MMSTKKHNIRESKKRKHRSRSKSRSPERRKNRHHKKHHKDRKKEKIKDKNGERISKFDNYDSEGKLHLLLSVFFFLQIHIALTRMRDNDFTITSVCLVSFIVINISAS